MSPAYTQIRSDVSDAVCVITLNRPASLNAWTNTMEAEFRQAVQAAADDVGVRVIMVTGAGRGFCAGADFNDLQAASTDPGQARKALSLQACGHSGIDANFAHRFSYLLAIGKPIVCAINGPIAGIGLCMALFADIRFMSDEAVLTTAFAARGLIAEHGSAWMLPRLVGPMNALRLFFLPQPIGAEQAEQLGLVARLPAEGFADAVLAYCRSIASTASPRSLRVVKQQVYTGLFQTLAESAAMGDHEMFQSFECHDFREGIAHYREKRAPRFTGE